MIICSKCESVLDPVDPSRIERKLCTPCIRNGALAGDHPDEVVKKVIKKNQVKVKLDFGYVWVEKMWWLDIKAILPGGRPFNLGLSRKELEMHLEAMKELKEPDGKVPPPG